MPVNTEAFAKAIVEKARKTGSEFTERVDVSHWSSELIRELVDRLLAKISGAGFRVKGIRTDTVGFNKFGVERDMGDSGLYNGVPVVITAVGFDTVEIVVAPL